VNVRLLRKIQKHILEEPKRLRMNYWFIDGLTPGARFGGRLGYFDINESAEVPECGTVGCIAGWACVLSGPKPLTGEWLDGRGQEALALTDDQRLRLFNVSNWPQLFIDKYAKAKTPRGRGTATASRIDHFIATKGKE